MLLNGEQEFTSPIPAPHLQRRKMKRDFIFDKEDSSIRGSFVIFCETAIIIFLIAYGVLCSEAVVDRLVKLTGLIASFFTANFGIWAAKSHMDGRIALRNGNGNGNGDKKNGDKT